MDIDKLADLLHRAKENDDAAINELYGQIHGVVWFWARAAVKSDDDADEVTQRTLITTFRKLDTIAEPKAFLGWLKTTTLRQAKDYMLAAHNRYDISFHDAGNKDDEGNESDYDPAAEGLEYNPEEALNEKTKKEILTGILDALPADQRLVVNMFWFENMTSKAISEELGCSENTIKSRLKYAKAKIKEKVEEYQKKTGEKLYSVSPIAVLLWLYKDAEKGKVMEIPWGAEAYPALEQTYHTFMRPALPMAHPAITAVPACQDPAALIPALPAMLRTSTAHPAPQRAQRAALPHLAQHMPQALPYYQAPLAKR